MSFKKAISFKNKLLTKFINKKDLILKKENQIEYKDCRDFLSSLKKKLNCFETNWNNNENKWKLIKSLISLKNVSSSAPTIFSLKNGDTTTNLYDIANTFNNYFVSIAETTKSNIKYSHKHYLRVSVILQYFCKLREKKKQLTPHLLLTLGSLLAQIVELIEYYFFLSNYI